MIIRIWRTQVNASRTTEYENFAQTYSLPMFRQQEGCLGVLFLRTEKDYAALSLWDSIQVVEKLAHSSIYQETVQQLQATGLLEGQQAVEVFEVRGGFLDLQALAATYEG